MPWPVHTLLVAALALVVERRIGYPRFPQRLVGHPVEWMGSMIAALERRWNVPSTASPRRRLLGAVAVCGLMFLWGGLAWLAHAVSWRMSPPVAMVLEALLATTLLAQRSLREHVEAVLRALEGAGDLAPARHALSMIVGRDTSAFDESAIAHATIESLAENTSDGIVAPLFWLMVAGLPGLAVYKLVNTADSMIGHLDERHRDFGWAAARLDDLLNWVPARMTGLLHALAAASLWGWGRAGQVARVMWRDARKHVSPNAGWPEAAAAAALGIRLGGPRSYQGRQVEFPWLGEGRARLSRADITAALNLHARLLNLLALLVVGMALLAIGLASLA